MKTLITASLIAFASLGTVSVQAAGDHAGHAMAAPAAKARFGHRFVQQTLMQCQTLMQ